MTGTRWIAAATVIAGLSITSRAAEPVRLRAPGTASAAGRSFPAEIRVICDGPKNVEVQFAITFENGAEAASSDSIFPFSVYEGPDGKVAPMRVAIAREKDTQVEMKVHSGAGWFGVENEYIFNLRAADAKRFLRDGETASTVTVTVTAGKAKLEYSFANVAATLGKPAASCR
jgi:hypothetical protein